MKKQGTLTKIKCVQCGKKFKMPYWRAISTKYCSQKCNGKSKEGNKHFAWKGGKPKCIDCNKNLVSYSAKRCKSCFGKIRIWSEETRRRIGDAHRGKIHSLEIIEKTRIKLLGRKPWNKGISKYLNINSAKKEWLQRRRLRYLKLTPKDRLADLLRTRIRNGLKYCGKSEFTNELLGCSYKFFKKYIESFFSIGMSWDNFGSKRGQWNIDHTMPISKFDLTNKNERLLAFNYTNCKPMWAYDNFKKGNRV